MHLPLLPDPQQTTKKLTDYSQRGKHVFSQSERLRMNSFSKPFGSTSSLTNNSTCSSRNSFTNSTTELPINAANENTYFSLTRKSVHHIDILDTDTMKDQTARENKYAKKRAPIHRSPSNASYFETFPQKPKTLSSSPRSFEDHFHRSKNNATRQLDNAGEIDNDDDNDDCIEFYLKIPPVHERQRLAKRSDLRERFCDPKRRGSSPLIKRSSSTLSQLLASLQTSDDR